MDVLALLVDKKIITAEDQASYADEAEKTHTAIADVLLKHGITGDVILKAQSERYGIPSRSLPASDPAERHALEYIPQESAEHYKFVPISIADNVLEVGVVDPDNIEALDALQFISTRVGMPYKLFLITQSDFDRVIEEYGSLTGEVDQALEELDPIAVEDKKTAGQETVAEPTLKLMRLLQKS
jgi:hypothetical protein